MRYPTPVLRGLDQYITAVPDDDPDGERHAAESARDRARLADRCERLRLSSERLQAQADSDYRFGLWFRARRVWRAWAHVERLIEDAEREIAMIDEEEKR